MGGTGLGYRTSIGKRCRVPPIIGTLAAGAPPSRTSKFDWHAAIGSFELRASRKAVGEGSAQTSVKVGSIAFRL